MSRVARVSVACPDLDAALRIGRILVEEGLAACCNAVPCRSVYRWEGVVEEAAEAVAWIKTAPDRIEALVARLVELHPYELPAIEWSLPEATPGTAAWAVNATHS